MICVTTNSIDGKVVRSYRGLVAAEVIFGANLLRDFVAAYTDAIGGRSGTYEEVFAGARKTALNIIEKKAEALGANAILATRFQYQVLGEKNGMMMVAVTGTAVLLATSDEERLKEEERAADDKPLYLVKIGNSEKGPFSVSQLKELAAAGRIEDSATVRIDGRDGTRSLADVIQKNG